MESQTNITHVCMHSKHSTDLLMENVFKALRMIFCPRYESFEYFLSDETKYQIILHTHGDNKYWRPIVRTIQLISFKY